MTTVTNPSTACTVVLTAMPPSVVGLISPPVGVDGVSVVSKVLTVGSVGGGVDVGLEISVLENSLTSTELEGGGFTMFKLVGAISGTSVVTGLAELVGISVLVVSVFPVRVGIGVA